MHMTRLVHSSVQFIYASRPSTEYFIRNTGTGSDGRSCHLRHCPHKFTQDNKIQMKHHSKNATKNMHSKDSYSAVNSRHINTFWKHFHCQKSIPNRIRKHCFQTGKLCKALTTWDDTVSPGQPISVTRSQQSNKQINNWKMRPQSTCVKLCVLDIALTTYGRLAPSI